MRIVTRAVGVFLVLTIQEVVCRQHEPDLVSPFHGKFKSSVEPEEMVRRGSIRDKIRVRIKPPLFAVKRCLMFRRSLRCDFVSCIHASSWLKRKEGI